MSDLQEEYQEHFRDTMDKHDVESPAEFEKEHHTKNFFNEVSDGWEKGVGKKSFDISSIVDSVVANVISTPNRKTASDNKMLSKELKGLYGKMSIEFSDNYDKFMSLVRKEVDASTAKKVDSKIQDVFEVLDEVQNILEKEGYGL